MCIDCDVPGSNILYSPTKPSIDWCNNIYLPREPFSLTEVYWQWHVVLCCDSGRRARVHFTLPVLQQSTTVRPYSSHPTPGRLIGSCTLHLTRRHSWQGGHIRGSYFYHTNPDAHSSYNWLQIVAEVDTPWTESMTLDKCHRWHKLCATCLLLQCWRPYSDTDASWHIRHLTVLTVSLLVLVTR